MDPNPFNAREQKQKPKGVLPDVIEIGEAREALTLKLAEYKKRLKPFTAPEVQWDTVYKIAVLEELLEQGQVNISAIKEKLKAKYGKVDDLFLKNACHVMHDYIQTGGANIKRGTGLPKAEKPSTEIKP